jgi:hypothetical protein
VKILVEVRELEPGRASSYAVANYVRAALKVQALRLALASALLEVEQRKKTLEDRLHADALKAEAEKLIREFGTDERARG